MYQNVCTVSECMYQNVYQKFRMYQNVCIRMYVRYYGRMYVSECMYGYQNVCIRMYQNVCMVSECMYGIRIVCYDIRCGGDE